MNKISATSLLQDMQSMTTVARQSPEITPIETAFKTDETQRLDFADLMKQAVQNVNSLQKESAAAKTALAMGEPGVDLPQVMMAAQKASVAFTATTEVRNKLVKAYETVMSMSV
jgi:flagellar hook-basal body complex protein FliE